MSFLSNLNRDTGLLVMRLGVGFCMMAFHGYGKITGGPDTWAAVGGNMAHLGLAFAPTFWGFMAAVSEFGASILLMLGVLFRPAAAMLAFTMFVATVMHLSLPVESSSSGWAAASNALVLVFVYVGLFMTGPGRYAFKLMRAKGNN